MSRYDAITQSVLAQIKEFGAPATLTRETEGSYDPLTDASTAVHAAWSTWAVLESLDATDQFRIGTVDHNFSKKAIVPALDLGTIPVAGDHLVDAAGNNWAVGKVDTVAPDAAPICFTLYLER